MRGPFLVIFIRHSGVSGSVESRVFRVPNIGIEFAAAIEEEVVFSAMAGSSEVKTGGSNGGRKLADHVSFRSHLCG